MASYQWPQGLLTILKAGGGWLVLLTTNMADSKAMRFFVSFYGLPSINVEQTRTGAKLILSILNSTFFCFFPNFWFFALLCFYLFVLFNRLFFSDCLVFALLSSYLISLLFFFLLLFVSFSSSVVFYFIFVVHIFFSDSLCSFWVSFFYNFSIFILFHFLLCFSFFLLLFHLCFLSFLFFFTYSAIFSYFYIFRSKFSSFLLFFFSTFF